MPRKYLPLLVLAFSAAQAVCAQKLQPGLGVRASMEITIPSGASDMYKTGAGLSIGPVYTLPVYKGLYFEPGVLFTYSAMSSKELIRFDDSYLFDGSAQIYGMRVPLYFGYSFQPTDMLRIGLYTGPAVNFNISARQNLDPNFALDPPLPRKTINLFDHGWKHVDVMWGFGLSFNIADNYQIGISGGVGITPLAKFGNRDKKVRIHRNIVALSLGYYF